MWGIYRHGLHHHNCELRFDSKLGKRTIYICKKKNLGKSTINFKEVHWQFQELFKLTYRQGITPLLFSCFPVARASWRSSSLLWGKVFAKLHVYSTVGRRALCYSRNDAHVNNSNEKETMILDHITFAHRRLFRKSVLREGFEPARLSNSPKTIPQGGTAPMSLMSRMLTNRKHYIGVTFTRIS